MEVPDRLIGRIGGRLAVLAIAIREAANEANWYTPETFEEAGFRVGEDNIWPLVSQLELCGMLRLQRRGDDLYGRPTPAFMELSRAANEEVINIHNSGGSEVANTVVNNPAQADSTQDDEKLQLSQDADTSGREVVSYIITLNKLRDYFYLPSIPLEFQPTEVNLTITPEHEKNEFTEGSIEATPILGENLNHLAYLNPLPETQSWEKRHSYVLETWNQLAEVAGLPTIRKLSQTRRNWVRQRWEAIWPHLLEIYEMIESSDFLCGRLEWKGVDFEFLWGSDNKYLKILEGKYTNERMGFARRRAEGRIKRAQQKHRESYRNLGGDDDGLPF